MTELNCFGLLVRLQILPASRLQRLDALSSLESRMSSEQASRSSEFSWQSATRGLTIVRGCWQSMRRRKRHFAAGWKKSAATSSPKYRLGAVWKKRNSCTLPLRYVPFLTKKYYWAVFSWSAYFAINLCWYKHFRHLSFLQQSFFLLSFFRGHFSGCHFRHSPFSCCHFSVVIFRLSF